MFDSDLREILELYNSLSNLPTELKKLNEKIESEIGESLDNMIKEGRISALISGIVYVKSYGAIGDGVNDDTEAIQRALNSSTNNKFGIVYFENGTYITGKLTIPSNITILGASNAIIKAKNSLNDYLLYTYDTENVTIANIQIDGNKANNDYVKNNFACRNFTIFNCVLQNFNDYNPIQCYGDNTKIISNHVFNTDACDLIAFSSGNNCVIADNILENAADTDIVVAAGAKNVTVTGNVCIRGGNKQLDNAQSIAIAGAEHVTVVGNVLIGNDSNVAGIRVYIDPNTNEETKNIIISNNVIKNFSKTQGIIVSCENCNITNNLLKNCGTSIYIGRCSNLILNDNTIIDYETAILFAYDECNKISIANNLGTAKPDIITYGIRFLYFNISDVKIVNNSITGASKSYDNIESQLTDAIIVANDEIDLRNTVTQPQLSKETEISNNNFFGCHIYISEPIEMEVITEHKTFNITNNYVFLNPKDKIRVISDVSDITWTWIGE